LMPSKHAIALAISAVAHFEIIPQAEHWTCPLWSRMSGSQGQH
jgi:hypothetical protein